MTALEEGQYYQVQARCQDGCPEHEKGQWRKSRDLPRDIRTEADAVKFLREYAEEFWRSKPYRLVVVTPPVMIGETVTTIAEIGEDS